MSWNPTSTTAYPMPEGGEGTVQRALWMFIEHTRLRGYTRQTQYGYARYGQEFVHWCQACGHSESATLPPTVLRSYQQTVSRLRKRDGEPLSIRAQLAKLVPVRAFLRWLSKDVPAMREALDGCELPKAPRTLPRALLSPREMERLLRQPDLSTPVGLRDRAILELFYGVGLRRMELIELDVDDLDRERMTLMIRQGKGGRDRVVPVGDQAMCWLIRYLEESRPRLIRITPVPQRLFLGRQGEPLSPVWLSGIVNGYLQRIRPGKRGACHLLRHSMATSMLENRADIRYIQAMLGHAQLSSTQIYTHVAMHQLRRVYEATHPAGARSPKPARARTMRHPLQRELQAVLGELPLNASWSDLIAALSQPVHLATPAVGEKTDADTALKETAEARAIATECVQI